MDKLKMYKASILIVEDNNIVMLELKDRLEEMGYNVIDTSSSGPDAIKKAELHKPDLIIMDIRLKGDMDGIETSASIKKTMEVPIVYLTAHADDNTLQRAKITEPYGYIIKPFEERELNTALEMALYKHAMEKRLRESEHWLSATLKSIGDALIATDSKGIIKIINHVAEELTGWKMQSAYGMNIENLFKIMDENHIEFEENPVITTLKNGSIEGGINHFLISKNGAEIPVDFSSAPISYETVNLAGVVLVFRDVTERIKAKELLVKQQKFLKTIIDTDPNYISVKNGEGKFELINKATAETLGISTDKVHGKYDSQFYRKEEIDYFRKTDKEVIESQREIFIPEERMIDSKGKIHLLQTFKRAIDSRDGDEKLVLSVGSDITELKKVENNLRDSEDRIKTLLKTIPDTVLRFAKDGMLLDYHTQTQNNLLINIFEIVGESIYKIINTSLAEKIMYFSEEAFSTNKVQIFEYTLETKSDLEYYEVRVVNNSRNEFIVIIKDITGMKKIQLELRELNTSKDKFFTIIAHDLRSPFNSLLGLTEYAASENNNLTAEEMKMFSMNISKSAKSIYNLLENLLQWSRIHTGRIDYSPDYFDLNELLNKIIIIYRNNLENKNISLKVDCAPETKVYADSNMVDTILRNLISNSIKFTNLGGEIKITTELAGSFIKLSVSDNGVGIREEILPGLFNIDQNTSSKGTQNETGSGLGLILCKEFVEMNKGKLAVVSKPGEGSTFSFTLPV
ncbi:MAG: PAS domain S-box protein [Ignavibacteriaceae bacterium]